jgi:hypothetical protein
MPHQHFEHLGRHIALVILNAEELAINNSVASIVLADCSKLADVLFLAATNTNKPRDYQSSYIFLANISDHIHEALTLTNLPDQWEEINGCADFYHQVFVKPDLSKIEPEISEVMLHLLWSLKRAAEQIQ